MSRSTCNRGEVYGADDSEVQVTPAIASLRERVEAIRRHEVARAVARLRGARPETRFALEALSTALVNMVLHAPISRLRESAREGSESRWAGAVSALLAPAENLPQAERGCGAYRRHRA